MKLVLGIDFDGVIHRYGSGDKGQDIYDIPTPGAREALEQYIKAFDVHIVSARASTTAGVQAIKAWMDTNRLPELPISNQKPPGELLVLIDDRVWLFRGIFPSVDDLLSFQPWWRRGTKTHENPDSL